VAGGRLCLRTFVGLPDGSAWVRDVVDGSAGEPERLGRESATRLLAAGARELLDAAEAAAV
jgi:hydroxymethylbilane synthase